MAYSFSIVAAVIQIISLLIVVLLIIVLISGIRYMYWKKKNDTELGKKIDKVIELLGKERS
jgi:uncharacterized iron-regulated membrane protein